MCVIKLKILHSTASMPSHPHVVDHLHHVGALDFYFAQPSVARMLKFNEIDYICDRVGCDNLLESTVKLAFTIPNQACTSLNYLYGVN